MKQLFIFPRNGNGIEALDCIDDEYDFLGFIDDNHTTFKNDDYPVFGRDAINKYDNVSILAVPGNSNNFLKRYKIISSLGIPNHRFANVIHKSAKIGKNVKLGNNILIMAGSVLTSNVLLGDHNVILPNSVIHHDVQIGSKTIIGSNVVIAGNTILGENCYIGSGTTIIHSIRIGDNTLVGMGSNVVNSFKGEQIIFGNPAKKKH